MRAGLCSNLHEHQPRCPAEAPHGQGGNWLSLDKIRAIFLTVFLLTPTVRATERMLCPSKSSRFMEASLPLREYIPSGSASSFSTRCRRGKGRDSSTRKHLHFGQWLCQLP